MLRHQLYDSIIRDGKNIEFAKYVEQHKSQIEKGISTDPTMIESLKNTFYGSHSNVDVEKLNEVWDFISPKLTENVGLVEFILDNDGQVSDYFFPWLINVFRSPATALEMSYGAGSDLSGAWSENILATDDPLVPFIKDDPAFVYNRERQMYVADLAASIQDLAWAQGDGPMKIVDFGAGRLTWVRRHGYEQNPALTTIYAFDKDPLIKPAELFESSLVGLGIYYKRGDLTAELSNSDCENAHLVILGGVASYIAPEVFAGRIMPAIWKLLEEQGTLFFDLQLNCPCYQHSMDILGWPAFDIPKDPSVIIDRVENMRKALWSTGFKFSAEYGVDTFNATPSSVMVTMQKVS